MTKIKVLIIDDSAVTRKMLSDSLGKSRHIEIVGVAIDPIIAINKIKKFNPDVLTLDINMPRMDGLTFLSKLMIAHPMPVIMVSALTDSGAMETIKALELGAVDFVLKPANNTLREWDIFSIELIEKVITASRSRIKRKSLNDMISENVNNEMQVLEKFTADVIIPKKPPMLTKVRSETIIAIGASTGGTEAITSILSRLSEDVPGIVIVQHMPEKFTKAFADRVNGLSKLFVKEAEQGDRLYKGIALVAPGNRHMLLKYDVNGYSVELNNGTEVNRHKPSVDVLFRSAAQAASSNSVGILLTGMGADGASALLEMREAGAVTIAQDEASSIVFGMPKEAIKLGAAVMVKNLDDIVMHIESLRLKQDIS